MAGKFSKNKEVESLSMEDGNPGYQSDLTSYEAACRADPSLQEFDKTLHDRADRVIRIIAGGAENPLTLNALGGVTTVPLEMYDDLTMVIVESKEDIRKDDELSCLTMYYLDSCLKLSEFYTSLEECLSRARDCQLSIELALVHFEEERRENVGGERYVKTLQELQKFKEEGNPFTDEFSKLFHLVHNQQVEMLQKLQAHKKKLDKNLKYA